MAEGKFVAYYRVSTDKQGRSKLGLEAQRRAVADFLNGGRWELVAEFTEVESGKVKDRPTLREALAACRKHKARLVVAKLDRLTRNTRFLLTLLDSGTECVFCDMPNIPAGAMGQFFLRQMVSVAELEAGLIGERTRAALGAAKARGQRLGSPAPSKGAAVAAEGHKARATSRAANVLPIIRQIERSGVTSLRGIAEALNARGIASARGGQWGAQAVANVMSRGS
jgi:DNA invertase Pin-like site-specific DNA recombinase